MEILGLQVVALLIGALIGGFIAVLIYRNNERKADPLFDKFDRRFAEMEAKLRAEIAEIKNRP